MEILKPAGGIDEIIRIVGFTDLAAGSGGGGIGRDVIGFGIKRPGKTFFVGIACIVDKAYIIILGNYRIFRLNRKSLLRSRSCRYF